MQDAPKNMSVLNFCHTATMFIFARTCLQISQCGN